jgi:hypothetical protein
MEAALAQVDNLGPVLRAQNLELRLGATAI